MITMHARPRRTDGQTSWQ